MKPTKKPTTKPTKPTKKPSKTHGVSTNEPSGQAVPWKSQSTSGLVRAKGTATRGPDEADSVTAKIELLNGPITHNPNTPVGTNMPLDGDGNWCGHLGAVSGNRKYGIAVWAKFGTEYDYAFHTFKTAPTPTTIPDCP